jgi:SAM-dependent methyltransferase
VTAATTTAVALQPCPLCGATDAGEVLRLRYSEIWDRLQSLTSARFTPDVIERHTPQEDATLYECRDCGLQYFSPKVAGDAEFYRQLMGPAGYEPERWDFDVAAAKLAPGESVLDIGCGEGAFLKKVALGGRRVVGIDHNVDAIERLGAGGIEAYAMSVEEAARVEREAFDVVCSFQTLEHLPEVDDLVRAARECTRPGGRILIGVPNRDRYARSDLEPYDCVPHHISRWSGEQLAALADRFDLELVGIEREPYVGRVERLFPRLVGERLGARAAHAYRRRLLNPSHYAKASNRQVGREIYGHGIVGEYRRPEA